MTTSNTCDQYDEQNANKSVQKEADMEQNNKKTGISQAKGIVNMHAKSDSLQENEVNRTRSGCIVQKPDRLTYIYIYNHSNSPADMSASTEKSYSQWYYFEILSIFLYDILLASQQGQHNTIAW